MAESNKMVQELMNQISDAKYELVGLERSYQEQHIVLEEKIRSYVHELGASARPQDISPAIAQELCYNLPIPKPMRVVSEALNMRPSVIKRIAGPMTLNTRCKRCQNPLQITISSRTELRGYLCGECYLNRIDDRRKIWNNMLAEYGGTPEETMTDTEDHVSS